MRKKKFLFIFVLVDGLGDSVEDFGVNRIGWIFSADLGSSSNYTSWVFFMRKPCGSKWEMVPDEVWNNPGESAIKGKQEDCFLKGKVVDSFSRPWKRMTLKFVNQDLLGDRKATDYGKGRPHWRNWEKLSNFHKAKERAGGGREEQFFFLFFACVESGMNSVREGLFHVAEEEFYFFGILRFSKNSFYEGSLQ